MHFPYIHGVTREGEDTKYDQRLNQCCDDFLISLEHMGVIKRTWRRLVATQRRASSLLLFLDTKVAEQHSL